MIIIENNFYSKITFTDSYYCDLIILLIVIVLIVLVLVDVVLDLLLGPRG